MACLAEPSFHEASGSSARARLELSTVSVTATSSDLTIARFTSFSLCLTHSIFSKRGIHSRSHAFLKIHTPLDEGAIQCSFVGESGLIVVVLQVTPAGLCPEPPADLKFKAALYLVAPIRAVHRFSRNRQPFALDFESGAGVGVKSTYIAFCVKRCRFPDLYSPAGSDHGIDPVGRTGERQLVADSQ